jgi:hypothetical protein
MIRVTDHGEYSIRNLEQEISNLSYQEEEQ